MSLPLSRLKCADQLRGFVAVGRRMSITKAAQDLYLTQSAISRQIQTLEEVLGVRLLQRGHRSIAFTPEGEQLFKVANTAFQQLQEVMGQLVPPDAARTVTVTASIGVAALWLLPRLGSFQAIHPDIEVRIASLNAMLDLREEGVDLAIRYCAAHAAPQGAQRLFGEAVQPVMMPALHTPGSELNELVQRHGLLEFDDPARPWLQWSTQLARAGCTDIKPRHVLRFNQYDQVIHAAAQGQGLALGRVPLIDAWLHDGRLAVAPTPPGWSAETDHAYWMVRAPGTPRADVGILADWIVSQG